MMLPVGRLADHPGNARQDLDLDRTFCASVAAAGVRIPLLVTPDGGGFRVIEGHRRLAAAVKAGLAEVPCVLDWGRAGDEAGQFLDMAVANSDSLRRNLTALEEADALFAASEAGATRARIRKATGRSVAEVKAALQAGRLSSPTRALAAELPRQPSLDELALLAEFDGDPDATGSLLGAIGYGYSLEHVAERIRQERAEAAQHDQLVAELKAAGVSVTDTLPESARPLDTLTHDGQDLTPETHAGCPGRGAYFQRWAPLEPCWYCTDPAAHGHADRYQLTATPTGGNGTPGPLPDPPASPAGPGDPGRRLVIEGNRAWAAAAEVRKRWLRNMLARRAAPRPVLPFLARQLLTMPEPLRACLGTAHATGLFAELAGRPGEDALAECDTSAAGRLPLLMLAAVVTAYEHEISGDTTRRNTWRLDQYAPCPRADAGTYLGFLASLGYDLSVIEQAVADGVPWTGDTPPGDPLSPGSDPADPAESGGASVTGEDPPGEPGPGPVGEALPVDPGSPPEEATSATAQEAA
jgi:ParB family chromosome partitioning protein